MTDAFANPPATTPRPARRWAGPTLVLAMLAWAFCFQGTRGIWEPDEGRYTAVALEMLRTGDWLHPQLNDLRPHYTKPPITYWALAASFKVFGVNEWAARLPNALAYAATAVGVFVLAGRLVPGKELLAAVVYATSAGPFVAANVVSTDTLLACWETWAVAGFAVAWTSRSERGRQGGLLLMGIMFGLAFATKGPPGLLPLGGLLPAAAWLRGWRGLRRCFSIAGVVAFLLIGGGWFAAVCIDRPSLVHYFLKDEVVARVASDQHKRNGEWYGWAYIYLPALLGGTLPWTHHWLVPLYKRLRLAWRRPRAILRGDEAGRLLALWVLVPLAVLCVAQSRMHLYVLPLLVPLSLIAARHVPADLLRQKLPRYGLIAWCAGLLVFKCGLAFAPTDKDTRAYTADLPPRGGGADEVLYVDTRPRYGLELYGHGPVQEVMLYPGTADADEPYMVTLAEALRRRRRRASSLLVVRAAQLPEIEPILSVAGVAWRRVGGRFDLDKVALVVGD